MAVLAHIGIRPHSSNKIGRFKTETLTAEIVTKIVSLAEQMVNRFAGSLLIEEAAARVARRAAPRVGRPISRKWTWLIYEVRAA